MDANVIIPAGTLVSLAGTLFFVWWRNVRRVHVEVEKKDGSWFSVGFSKNKPCERPPVADPPRAQEKASEGLHARPFV